MERFLQHIEAAWQGLTTLDGEAWLLLIVTLMLLQLVALGRSARRLSGRLAAMEAHLKEISERAGMILDLMVDAEERLLGIQRRAHEAATTMQRQTEGSEPSGRSA